MIKALVFDLDDTLYDEMQFVRGGFRAVSNFISLKYMMNEDYVYNKLLKVLKEYGRGKTFDITLQELGIIDKDIIQILIEIYRSHTPDLGLYSDVKKILDYFKENRFKLGIITDGDITVQKNKVLSLRLKKFFDFILFTDEYGVEKQKPNPFPYEKMIEIFDIDPSEMVYVGDNPNKDFITAKRMGILTIRVKRGPYKNTRLDEMHEADYSVSSFLEIPYIIENCV